MFSVGGVLCVWEAEGRRRQLFESKSLVDFSLSLKVNIEAYHLRGAWKSQST